ncbi:MAG: hypothetical protein L0G70_00660 [Rubrobacter sp.]|nr:hypothetical protein [Rubrobacter sp.]
MDEDAIYNVPVPKRFLPLINRTLADAYAAESTAESRGPKAPGNPAEDGEEVTAEEARENWYPEKPGSNWTRDEVALVYRDGSPKLRAALDYIAEVTLNSPADNPEREVTARELAHAVYPDDSSEKAENRLYGVLRNLTHHTYKQGKEYWFFRDGRERNPDGSHGGMVYTMSPEVAEWLREESGRQKPE